MKRRTLLACGSAGVAVGLLAHGAHARGDTTAARAMLAHIRRTRLGSDLSGVNVRSDLATMARDQAFWMYEARGPRHHDPAGHDPVTRARRAGYDGQICGETLAETFEDAANTATAWLGHGPTRDVLLDPNATEIGVFALREDTGRIWWDVILGTSPSHTPPGLMR